MSGKNPSKVKNISLVAHHGAGKTLLTEALLFNAKALDSFSPTKQAQCPLDEEPEEQTRNMTLSPKLYSFSYNGSDINLIDTPGYINFLADTTCSLMAGDASILVVSALSGVKETSMEFWNALNNSEMPRFLFINKMDKEKANFIHAISSIEKDFKINPTCFTIPMGAENSFKGVIDILNMKALTYSDKGDGTYKTGDIPAEYMDDAAHWREKLMEAIIETDDDLMSAYLDGEDIPFDKLMPLLKEAIINKTIMPVFAGSAIKDIGISPMLDAALNFFPSADSKKLWEGKGKDNNTIKRKASKDEPFSAFVFKTSVDHFSGKLNFLRIVSGEISAGDTFTISNKDIQGKVIHISKVFGSTLKKVGTASCGDIIAFDKCDKLETGDTLSQPSHPIIYKTAERLDRSVFCSVRTMDRASEEKVMEALFKIMEEDPNIEYHRDEETKELLLSGMGQFHLEIVKDKIKRKYDCDIELDVPSIPYKETIKTVSSSQGKLKKQSGGHGQFGDCWIELSPLPRGKHFEFENNIVGGVIPKNFIPSVEKGIVESMEKGILAGYPVVDIKARLYDGSYHSVDSSDMAFKVAGSIAFKKCMEKANPILLEPIMNVKITVPTDTVGAIIQDMNGRRGRVMGVEPKADAQIIRAQVPLNEMLTYDNTLKGITQGKGIFTMHHHRYEEVPSPIAAKIIEKRQKEKEDNNH